MEWRDFDPEWFLREVWQRKPLLIRQAFVGWDNPLEPDELAGLACEEGIEARLVRREGADYKLENGPFAEERFAALGEKDWSLLVQAVDHHVPEVAAMLEAFRFIPNWRIDDVMVSYATAGGGVGPHFDQYDVFLFQGLGQRRWQVGPLCDEASPLVEGADLRLLANFTAVEDYVLEAGDMLYLPPGFAHDGVSLGSDCMTYSIGFRAPSRHELIGLWADDVLEGLVEDDRYGDAGLALQPNSGEIAPEALARMQAMVMETLGDKAAFARWFGRYSSQPKYPEVDWAPQEALTLEDLRAAVLAGASVERNPASRFAFVEQGAGVLLFVDGQDYACEGEVAEFARAICGQVEVDVPPALAQSDLLLRLVNSGSLALV